MKYIFLLVFLIACVQLGAALECYTCSVGEQDVDTTCIDDPVKGATKTNCNKKYCTIIRQEYLDPQGKVASMFRGCEDSPTHMNEIVEDETYRFYYTACQERLCNGGSGKSGDGGSKGGELGDKSTIIAPGIAGAVSTQISLLLIITTLYLSLHNNFI